MKISASARHQIEGLLAASTQGALPSLLVGYTYDEHRNKSPQVDLTVFSAAQVRSMRRDLAGTRDQPFKDIDGITFLLPLSYKDALLDGWILVYAADGFTLARADN